MLIKKIKANAKINLGLNITGKNEKGYHNLDMIVAPISLYDEIEIKFYEKEGNLEIKSNKSDIPIDSDNIIYKIYEKYYYVTGLQMQKIEVYLDKRIPVEAGLGGGSSDGAFFLKELNAYHDNYLDSDELIFLAKTIGADIPFFILNKTSRIQGIGEKIRVIENCLDVDIILVKPKFGISTKEAYTYFSNLEEKKNADIDNIIEGLIENNLKKVNDGIENHLQQSIKLISDEIKSFEVRLKGIDLNFKMSGSGSCYYLIIERENSKIVYDKLIEEFNDCFVSRVDFI
jgi:4-diphosphocytidyl-2-C-methyl-D-erythritol kinase